jgi:hypothetical protein
VGDARVTLVTLGRKYPLRAHARYAVIRWSVTSVTFLLKSSRDSGCRHKKLITLHAERGG